MFFKLYSECLFRFQHESSSRVLIRERNKIRQSVADPGFHRGGAPTLRGGGGALTYDFAKFSQKLHEIERIWTTTDNDVTIFILISKLINKL